MSAQNITAKGQTGTVAFDGSFVTIERKGLLARTMVGAKDRRIPVASIAQVIWQQPGFGSNGWISFALAGVASQGGRFNTGMQNAAHDEYSVMVTRKQAPDFLRLRDAVEGAIAGLGAPAPPITTASPMEQLKQLSELHAAGIVSDDEFAAKKADLLGRM